MYLGILNRQTLQSCFCRKQPYWISLWSSPVPHSHPPYDPLLLLPWWQVAGQNHVPTSLCWMQCGSSLFDSKQLIISTAKLRSKKEEIIVIYQKTQPRLFCVIYTVYSTSCAFTDDQCLCTVVRFHGQNTYGQTLHTDHVETKGWKLYLSNLCYSFISVLLNSWTFQTCKKIYAIVKLHSCVAIGRVHLKTTTFGHCWSTHLHRAAVHAVLLVPWVLSCNGLFGVWSCAFEQPYQMTDPNWIGIQYHYKDSIIQHISNMSDPTKSNALCLGSSERSAVRAWTFANSLTCSGSQKPMAVSRCGIYCPDR